MRFVLSILCVLIIITVGIQPAKRLPSPVGLSDFKSGTFEESAEDKPAGKQDLITLERGPCFGTCPIYKVSIASDGKVTFEGHNYTRVKGKVTGRIKAKEFRKLVKEFEQIKYFTLDERYVPGEPNCGPAATDMPYVKSSIQLGGRTKSISHYQGCLHSEVVRALFALDRRIDEVAGTAKWIK